jgi:hypothetical protein
VTVYKIKPDINAFRRFYLDDAQLRKSPLLDMDCSAKLGSWAPPAVHIEDPKLKNGTFLSLCMCSGAFVVNLQDNDHLRTLLEKAAELLPLPCGDTTFYLVNILKCVDCLDYAKTTWDILPSGLKLMIRDYQFNSHKVPQCPLFKLPNDRMRDIFTCTGLSDPNLEFKTTVERAGLKGLLFQEVWSL